MTLKVRHHYFNYHFDSTRCSTGGFSEAESKTYVAREYRYASNCIIINIHIYPLSGLIVQKLLEYMCFKAHYEKVGPKEEVPVNEFLERIPPEIVLEL